MGRHGGSSRERRLRKPDFDGSRGSNARQASQPFLIAEGTVPINLALTGVTGSRFPTNRQIALNINADSLPLELIPQLSDYVSQRERSRQRLVQGRRQLNKPQLTGQFAMHATVRRT